MDSSSRTVLESILDVINKSSGGQRTRTMDQHEFGFMVYIEDVIELIFCKGGKKVK